MKTNLLVFAFILLFNPQINVIDIFPDFLGWFLIYCSLKRVRHLSFQLDNAADSAYKMIWLTFAGFGCILLYPHVDGTMMLTVNFALNSMKLLWGIPAFRYLFDGITELSGLYSGTKIYEPIGRSKKEGVHSACKTTLVFYVSSCILNALPEFSELSAHSSKIMSEGYRPLITFKPLFYAIAFIVTLIIGIVWLSVVIPFIGKFKSDKLLFQNINEAYTNKIINTGKHRALILISQLMLTAISGLFIISVTFDSVNIVPEFVLPIIILCVSLKIASLGYNTKLLSVVSAITSIVSLTAYVLRISFNVNYSYEMVTRSFSAYNFYTATVAVLALEFLLLITQRIILTRLLLSVAERDASREILSVSPEQIEKLNRINYLGFKKKAIISTILFILTALLNIGNFVISYIFPVSWIIVLIFGVIWLVYSYNLYSGLRDDIERKYL